MESLAIPVLGLAVIDSINPSALAVALWWLARPGATSRLLAYIAGIFVAYLSMGIALMLGAGAVVRRFGDALDHPVVLAVQLAIGLSLFAYAVLAPKVSVAADTQREPRVGGLLGMALLGATVTLVELTTALPYFAAVALMTAEGIAATRWLPLLLVYNLIFVAPPLLLVGLNLAFGRHLQGRFAHWRVRLQAGAREAGLWVMAMAGIALSGDAITRYLGQRDTTAPRAETVSASPRAPG
ncbi:GAP family protein [Lysobacter sp. FW306-1B-D06B]|uniref:GAP family protein n=1 Tax=Lysobacter sp. FW306-1B-D06B TaxID=3140250 RepID=UPI003140B663